MKTDIGFSELPEALQERVNKDLENYKDSILLGCQVSESTPYTDKSRKLTSYKAYLEWGNLYKTYRVSFDGSVFDGEIHEDSMIAGEIDFLVRHSDWLKSVAEQAVEEKKRTG